MTSELTTKLKDRDTFTDHISITYNDYPLDKLKKMIVCIGNQPSDNDSMDFRIFKNLSLSHLQLTYLPTNFAHDITNLSSLDLSHNKLQELPHSFHLLSKLEHLNMDNNDLVSLPNSFTELKHLKTLNLVSNKLKVFPESFGCLFNLETLDLSDNQFVNLPISCVNLNRLFCLKICNNQFIEVPECVTSGMKNLHILDVSRNRNILMNKAPASIHLTKFIAKDIGQCKYFPQWILWIKYNQLREITLDGTTFKFYSCPKEKTVLQITRLSISDSNLSDFMIEEIICNMVRLENLDLSNKRNHKDGNNFWQMPFEKMKVFHTLKEVNISATSLPFLSGNISNFCNLVKIDLSYNLITWLPNEFTELKKLEELIIDHGKFLFLPMDIGEMKNLRELKASYNSIPQVPESLLELKNLRLLDLYDNMISEVPEEIFKMDNLKMLDLEQNFVDTSELMARNNSYKDLKDLLRHNMGTDDNRGNGIKIEANDDTCDVHSVYHYSENSDFSTSSDSENIETNSYDLSSERSKSVEEDWDSIVNPSDEFDPCTIGAPFRRPMAEHYVSMTTFNDYFCPADSHPKPVKYMFAERNIENNTPMSFEEGQFDDV